MPAEGKFDPAVLLDFTKANLHAEGSLGLNGDRTITLRWTIPPGSSEEVRSWIASNRRTISKFTVEQRVFGELWRHVGIEIKEIDSKDRNKGSLLLQTFALGYITSLASGATIDWAEARWAATGALQAPGNTSSALGLTDTASDNDAKYLSIEFKNCAPEKAASICGEFTSANYTDVAVEGEPEAGTWHRIFASWRKEDDGSATVTIRLAQPQYTLEAFQNLALTSAEDIYYLWSVPKNLAQEIINDWKTSGTDEELAGRGATASFSEGDQIVNLILTAKGNPSQNLTTTPITTTCDTIVVYHFAWGYTETAIAAFLTAHGGTNNHAGDVSGVAGQPTPLSWSGRSRETRTSNRADGLFDATVVESKTAYDPDKHLLSITTTTGVALVRVTAYGWRVPMSRIDAIKASYNLSAVGITTRLQVTRQDECTFDYIGEIITEGKQTFTLTVTGSGEDLTLTVVTGYTQTELDAITPESGPRIKIESDLNVQENGLVSGKISKREILKTIGEMSTGVLGEATFAYSGDNVDLTDLATVVQSAARARVSLGLTGNSDGTFNYRAEKRVVQATNASITSGSSGEGVTAYGGRNLDSIASVPQSGKRERVDLSVSPNDDGTLGWSGQKRIVQEVFDSGTATTGAGMQTAYIVGRNKDVGDAASCMAVALGQSASFDLLANDDGTINFSGRIMTPVKTVVRGLAQTGSLDEGVVISLWRGVNALHTDFTTALADATAGIRKSHNISYNPNDAGGIDYVIVQQEESSPTGAFSIPATTSGEAVEVKAGNCVSVSDLAAVAAAFTAAKRKRINVSIDPRADGGFRYVITSIETRSKEITTSGGTLGSPETISVGNDVDDMPTVVAPGVGERVNVSARPNSDGSLSYEVRRIGCNAVTRSTTAGSYSQRRRIVATARDPEALSSYTPDKGLSYDITIRLDDDGSVEWQLVEITRQGMSKSFAMSRRDPWYERGGFSDTVTVFEGLDNPPSPGGDYYYFESISINDDYTFNGILHNLEYDWKPSMWSWIAGRANMLEYEYMTQGFSVYRRQINYAVAWSTQPFGHLAVGLMNNGIIGKSTIDTLTHYGRTMHLTRTVTLVSEGNWELKASL